MSEFRAWFVTGGYFKRDYDKVERFAWPRRQTPTCGGSRARRMVPLVFEGALDGELFRAYVTRCLAPSFHF
jgi:hypothetical protein